MYWSNVICRNRSLGESEAWENPKPGRIRSLGESEAWETPLRSFYIL